MPAFKESSRGAEANEIGDFSAVLGWIEKRRTEIETYARERGVGSKHWEPDRNAKNLAIRHDRFTEHMDIRIANQFVHGSTFATSQRYSRDEEGAIMVGGPAVERELWAITAGCSAAQSALIASRSLCAILEIDEPDEMDRLFETLQSLADRIKGGIGSDWRNRECRVVQLCQPNVNRGPKPIANPPMSLLPQIA